MLRTIIYLFAFATMLMLAPSCEPEGKVVSTDSQLEGGDAFAKELKLEYLDLEMPAQTYLVFRQELSLLDMNGFLAIESDSLLRKTGRAGITGTGSLSSLFYVWDTEQGYGDAAVALPVETGTKLLPYASVEIPAGQAIAVEFDGGYERLSAFHVALSQELTRRGLVAVAPSIEQYIVGPAETTDASKFKTRVIYPYKQAE